MRPDKEITLDELVTAKLIDAETPGAEVPFDPDEADLAGAFIEDALTVEEAAESVAD